MRSVDTQVLIVGGGGAGLTASNILARLGVDSLLVERHPGTSHLPKAHYFNQRTMEIFRQMGMDQAIYARGAPAENMGKIVWQTSLGGDGPLDGRVIYAADGMGGGRMAAEHAEKGPTRGVNIPQLISEPVLRAFAEEANPDRVLFSHEFVGFAETADGIEATIRDLAKNENFQIRARYLIAADAGKTVGPALGVSMIGPSGLGDFVGIYFKADLSSYIQDDTAVMRLVHRTEHVSGGRNTGGLLTMGPTRWDRHSEEWAVGWGYAPDDPARHDESNIVEQIQEFLKIDAPIEVKLVSHWELEAVVAERFRVGRAFLVGDAAHRHTPMGGLGLNSAIQDVHNLCWKIAAVLAGQASDALLDTYDSERRPVVQRNAENSLLAYSNHSTFVSAMGLIPGAPHELNQQMLAQLFADTADGRQRRARLAAVFEAVSATEYGPHDLEMGFQYDSPAVVDDGAPWPTRDPLGSYYEPSSHPGCRLPHAWLQRDGDTVSTHDLMPMGGFLLLTTPEGGGWVAAAEREAAARGLPIRAYRVGAGCVVTDPSGAWERLSGIGEGGAVLVRPDGHVGFRTPERSEDPAGALSEALDAILAAGAR